MTIRLEALPDLVDAIAQLADLAAPYGVQFTTQDFGGYRTEADTAQILGYRDAEYASYAAQQLAAGRTPIAINKWRPIAPYGKSFHDYGAARDLRIVAKPVGMSTDQALQLLGQLAPSAGLKWGGTFNDPVHFQLAIPLAAAAAAWSSYAGDVGAPTPSTSGSSSSAIAFVLVVLAAGGILFARRHNSLNRR